ncbi:MAG: DUF1460 domain-containing protein, partial [Gammaproteobacteria bacterium]|nr:DUF1460 domain-containing protein [Gammaproteobacteria bacterium]
TPENTFVNIDGGVAAKISADAGLAVPKTDTTRRPRRVHLAWLGVLSLLSACASVPAKPTLDLGRFSPQSLQEIVERAGRIEEQGQRIDFLSRQFLDVPYGAERLVGTADTPEALTINLAALDCYTYLDYVEALRRSTAFDEFPQQVTAVRYREGEVSWRNRRHFFSDWVISEAGPVRDVTARLGGAATVYARKELNRADEGGVLLEGIPVVQRTVAYIPAGQLDESLTQRLATGDYLGVYAHAVGLDVTHAGIAIRRADGLYFRHASTLRGQRRVVEVPLLDYFRKTPGMVVFRVPPTARFRR